MFLEIWQFLNQNLISEAIGALVFGFIAAFLFYKFSSSDEDQAINQKVKVLLKKNVEQNLSLIPVMRKILPNQVPTLPNPFSTSSFQIALQGKFIEKINPNSSVKLLELYDDLITANKILEQIREFSIGIAAAMNNSSNVRGQLNITIQKLFENIEKRSVELLKELKKGGG